MEKGKRVDITPTSGYYIPSRWIVARRDSVFLGTLNRPVELNRYMLSCSVSESTRVQMEVQMED